MSLFAELKRRNVVRVGIAYVVVAWLAIQITDVMIDNIGAPDWVFRTLLLVLAVGFPLALVLAWAFELTPEGIKREAQLERSASVAPRTGRKLDYAIVTGLLLIAVYFIWESRFKALDEVPGAEKGVGSNLQELDPTPFSELDPTPFSPLFRPFSPALRAPALPGSVGRSIAVLPFANRSNQDDDLFFTDGIHDDLLTQLAKLDGLKVISRTSVMAYRDTTRKIPEIAAELGVSTILEGGVQRAGDRIRINVQLIDVKTDEHLWAETFDREMTIDNIFDIQSEITRQIVTAVRGELSDSEAAQLVDRPTQSLEAWEAFLQAKAIIDRTPGYTAEIYQQAQPWVERAVAADPQFAAAWALLTEIYLQGIWMGYANTPAQQKLARDALDRAIALAPGSAAVLRARADFAYRVNLDFAQGLALLEQALILEPGNADTLGAIGTTLRRLGRWEEAIDAFERTLALDPLNAFAATTYAETLLYMNDWDRLELALDRLLVLYPDAPGLIEMQVNLLIQGHGQVDAAYSSLNGLPAEVQGSIPGSWNQVAWFARDWDAVIRNLETAPDGFLSLPIFHFTKDMALAMAYFFKGELESARPYLDAYKAEFMNLESASDYGNGFRLMRLSVVEMALGNTRSALELASRATDLLPMEGDWLAGAALHRSETLVLAMAGQRDLALERIAAHLDQAGGYTRWELYLDPSWDFFRDDERFNELIRPDGVEPEPFRPQRPGDGT